MKIAVLGTGDVGRALGARFVECGHEVRLGSRTADHDGSRAWAAAVGSAASHGTFADAANWGEVVVNATNGLNSLAALTAAGKANLSGKILIDVANPLDFSAGFPPSVVQNAGRSLAEDIQDAFPQAQVVKALNTMANSVMVNPRVLPSSHSVFIAGDHALAKDTTRALLMEFGWGGSEMVDLGPLSSARGLEMYLPLWLSLYSSGGSGQFNIGVVRS